LDSSPYRIIDLTRKTGASHALAPAILDGAGRVLTYGQLLNQIEHIGETLGAAGIMATDRVALVASNGPDMIAGFLGIAAVAACAPLNPSYTAAEFEFFLRDLQPRLLIIENGLSPPVRGVAQALGIPVWVFVRGSVMAGEFAFTGRAAQSAAPARFAGEDATALVLHTSGTTSRPKMVPLTQRNLCHSAFNIALSLDLGTLDRCVSFMPLFHIHGLIGAVLSTFASGGSLICVGDFDAAAFFGWLGEFRPTWFTAVPTMHAAVLARADRADRPVQEHSLRFIRSCSAPLPLSTLNRLESFFRVPVIEAYGMTEAAHQIASNPLPPGRRKYGSVGIATGTDIAVVSAGGASLQSGEAGEIVIRGTSITDGYLGGDPSESGFIQDWLRTGDLGWLDRDGYLFISGRIKEIINRGGEKVSPREVEEVLLGHPEVAEAIVFAVPDARLGEEVGAAVVLRSGVIRLDEKLLRDFAGAALASFKVPRHVVFVSEIPKGPTGKPQRRGLAERLNVGMAAPPPMPLIANRDLSLEAALLSIWCEILDLENLSAEDNFFAVGGDSLAALKMLLEVERRHHAVLTIADLLNAPTVNSLAGLIEQIRSGEPRSRIAVIQQGQARPAFFGIGAGPRFRELAKLLGPDQPFLAPTYPDPVELPRPCRLQDIARHHVGTIRAVQRRGPYFLGGWCVDGVVAYEIAQQLRAAGELVALLVLFDPSVEVDIGSLSCIASALVKIRKITGTFSYHLRALAAQPTWADIMRYASRHLHRIGERLHDGCLYFYFCLHGRRFPDRVGWRVVSAVQHRIAAKYELRPYDGPVLLLSRSVRRPGTGLAQQIWHRLVQGPLEVHQIEGDHGDMFELPQVALTAEILRRKLRK